MRLVLAEYISALKEDGELDKLLQDILKAHRITIFSRPERGRQYGVDIYAVGKDFEDGGKKKVFLITVKQGDIDRLTWNGDPNAVYQSLEEIRTVFIKNNLASQHKKLPIKIIVAYNGSLRQSVQQNWRGYEEANAEYEFALWPMDWFLDQFEDKLLNEQGFSNEMSSLVRKTIIHLENPDYDLKDLIQLLELFSKWFRSSKSKRQRLKLLKELQVIISILLKYCDGANNLDHAIRISEKYILMVWSELIPFDPDKEYTLSFVAAHHMLMDTFIRYYHKIGYVGTIRDGFGRNSSDSLIYTYSLYKQIGIFAMTGLIILQLCEIVGMNTKTDTALMQEKFTEKATEIASTVIRTINNNTIFYTPRADDQHIEISLVFLLLYKLGLKEQIASLLQLLNNQMGEGLLFSNVFPEFTNSRRKIAELEVNYDLRKNHKYEASNLYTVLVEWAVVIGDENIYRLFRELKEQLLKETDLLLWFPEKNTEDILYKEYATLTSGYALSNISLPKTLAEYKRTMVKEFENNCEEKEFSFIKGSIWSLGLLASRHYRTYVFPYYWRQFLES